MRETHMYDWTIMIYFAADNNLSEEMIWAIKDIQQWQLSENRAPNVKVRMLFDAGGPPIPIEDTTLEPEEDRKPLGRLSASEAAHENEKEQGLVLAQAEDEREKAHAKEKARPKAGRIDSVPAVSTTLQGFIYDSVTKHPATRYMLVLSGHGSGAVGDFLTGDKRISGLTIPDLGTVLAEASKKPNGDKLIDILGMDSCQMSMAEVACQVKDNVTFMVGSEGFELNTGWPYAEILGLLNVDEIKNDPGKFAQHIVRTHSAYYLDYGVADLSTDMSALNLTHFGKLEEALKKFTNTLDLNGDQPGAKGTLRGRSLLNAIVLAHWSTQGYKKEQYADLWDFCDQLSRQLNPGPEYEYAGQAEYKELWEACREIKEVIEPRQAVADADRFVRLSGFSGPQFQHSHGISVFFPWALLTDAAGISDLEYYDTLKFAARTAWDDFLSVYLKATQREVRTKDTTGDPDKNLSSLLNRRSGLFIPKPGRDPEGQSADRTKLGTARIESMKNPPIEWRRSSVSPRVAKANRKTGI